MARPRQFDEETVRVSTLQTFLQNGYASTSLSDLEEATGLGRRSLYNSFGDKRTVFLRALQDFRAIAVEQNLTPVDQPGASIEAIADVLNGLIKLAQSPQGRLGCLICNTAREPVANDPAVAEQIELYFSRIERGFTRVLEMAQANGELPAGESITSLARFYLGILVSICVLARAGASIEILQDIASEALRRVM
ncbi:MAG: TetR/AcrR family transcriptional regulator [Cyanobacteria bacterium J06636_16]